jgi:hypothetical protein
MFGINLAKLEIFGIITTKLQIFGITLTEFQKTLGQIMPPPLNLCQNVANCFPKIVNFGKKKTQIFKGFVTLYSFN